MPWAVCLPGLQPSRFIDDALPYPGRRGYCPSALGCVLVGPAALALNLMRLPNPGRRGYRPFALGYVLAGPSALAVY